ncbi:hypothetical protein [Salicibibacter kimchii]|uniref:GNAT family N-acetyltransferase n=1 Tax=Salicibibacter kimchii TaxID=2099786 RepID=A0A345BWI9_9BACI|nr:hypothetical protein [Salicibibacter kimchii]AXF55320.1 hypothetical protein DT065_04305 [Salicibibacter kimchii]
MNGELQALMSYEINEGFILIELLESAPSNSHHAALKVTPPMFAAASSINFEQGFEGFTVIHIKYHPSIISHYKQYGAELIRPGRMLISPIASHLLIKLYLKKGDRYDD